MVIYMLFVINFADIFAKIATRRLSKTIFFKKISLNFVACFCDAPGRGPSLHMILTSSQWILLKEMLVQRCCGVLHEVSLM